jgi:hypothetical protein
MLLSSFPPLVLYSPARVFPGIPLLLLSIVSRLLESWFRDKYIVYLSMLCALFPPHTSMYFYNKRASW